MQKLLIVDEDPWVLHSLTHDLAQEHLQIQTCDDVTSALGLLWNKDIDIVIVGCRAPGDDTLEFLRRLQRRHPQTVRILLGAAHDLDAVASRIQDANVFRVLRKPWQDAALRAALADARSYRILQQAASAAIGRVRDMEATSVIRSAGVVDFGPDGSIVVEDTGQLEDLHTFDFSPRKPRH
jgi:DNA-binding NtrC family response regulator